MLCLFSGQDYTMVVLVWDISKCSQKLVNQNCLGKNLSNKVFAKHKAIADGFLPCKAPCVRLLTHIRNSSKIKARSAPVVVVGLLVGATYLFSCCWVEREKDMSWHDYGLII